MRAITFVLAIATIASGLAAAESEKEMEERLQWMRLEVAARRLVRAHDYEKKKVPEADLAAARAVIRRSEERKAREVAPGPDGSFTVEFKDSDMKLVQTVCGGVYGGNVVIGSRIVGRKVSLSVAAPSLDEFRKKLQAELEQRGIYFIYRPDAMILDLERDSYKYPMHAK